MDAKKQVTLTLPISQVNTALIALAAMPFRDVASIITEIHRQVQFQAVAPPEQ